MTPFHTSTILLAIISLSAWLSLQGSARLVAVAFVLGLYVTLFSLGVSRIKLGFFAASFCRGKEPGAGVVLTFDDGPDPGGTKGLLEILARHGVRAAFFPLGMKAEAYPDLLRAIDQGGHVIGNHTYRHAWFTNFMAGKSLEREIAKAQKAVEAAIGKVPSFFRPPAGLTNPHYPSVLRRLGLHLVGWDVRVFDTKKKAETVVESLVSRARHGSILLIHEACREPESLQEIVDAVIKGIRGRGLAFTDLEQLSGIPAYQEAGEDGEPAALSITEVWRRSGRETKKGRLRRFAGMWLASTAAGRRAIREQSDLTAFKGHPSARFLTGVGVILFSYVLGWPMVGLFGFLAAYLQAPDLLVCGPVFYGFSHLVFLAGLFLAGRESLKYLEIFSLWTLRSLAERLAGRNPAKGLGADSV